MSLVDGPAWEAANPQQVSANGQAQEAFKSSEELAAYVKGLESHNQLASQKVNELQWELDKVNREVNFLREVILNLSSSNKRK